MNAIFISYRRSDSEWIVARLHDHLADRLPQLRLYRDVDSIPIAVDFREEIEKYIRVSEVVLVVIGGDWLTVKDALGNRRLDDPRDFVRAEIAAALEQRKRIVPLLVDGAVMPSAEQLSSDLKPLAYLNALKLRADPDFRFDFQRLIDYLDEIYPSKVHRLRRRIAVATAVVLLIVFAAAVLFSDYFRADPPAPPPKPLVKAEEQPEPDPPEPISPEPQRPSEEPGTIEPEATPPGPDDNRRPQKPPEKKPDPVPPEPTTPIPPPHPKPRVELPTGPVRVVLVQLKCIKPTTYGGADELRLRILADGKQYEAKYPDKNAQGRTCKLMKLEENWPLGYQFDFNDRVRVELDELDTVGADDRAAFQFEITKQDFIKNVTLEREAHFIGEYHLEIKWPEKE